MTTRPSMVESELEMQLVAPGSVATPVRADLRYDLLDPYAVQVSFHTRAGSPGTTVQWTFARSLLGDGLSAAAGEGDVQVWPGSSQGRPVVCLSLCSPSGRALFEVPQEALAEFLQRSYAAVPAGRESGHVDVEAELALLLWAGPDT